MSYLGEATADARASLPIPTSVCSISACPECCQSWGFFMHAQMLMHAKAHSGCTNTIREFALKVEKKKNPLLHWQGEPVPQSETERGPRRSRRLDTQRS